MSLPAAWVEKIFAKLALVYGRDFIGRWEGMNLSDVKTDWGHELSGFAKCPEAIAYALQNLPDGKPPTVIQFRAIANKMPQPEHLALPAPSASPEIKALQLAAQAAIRQQAIARDGSSLGVDPKGWAKRIIARHEAGEKVRPVSLRFAREALRIPVGA